MRMSKIGRYIRTGMAMLIIAGCLVSLLGCTVNDGNSAEVEVETESEKVIERKTAEFEVNGNSICVDYTDAEEAFLEEFEKDTYLYQLYDSSELTGDMLEHRNGSVIVERCIGIVVNKETGDGRLLNYPDPDYYYISYNSVDDVRDGTIVLSYMVYNHDNNYIDDISERYDYVVSRELED